MKRQNTILLLLSASLLVGCGANPAASSPEPVSSEQSAVSSIPPQGETVTYSISLTANGVPMNGFFLNLVGYGQSYFGYVSNGSVSIEAPSGVYEVTIDDLPGEFILDQTYTSVESQSLSIDVLAGCRSFDLYHQSFIGDTPFDFTYPAIEMVDGTVKETKVHYEEEAEKHDIMILNIFSTYCGPCRSEFPLFEQIFSDASLPYKEKVGFLALDDGVFRDADNKTKVAQMRQDIGITSFPTLWASDKVSYNFPAEDGYLYFPTTIVIDKFGFMASIEPGAFGELDDVKEFLDYYLSDSYVPDYVIENQNA